MSSAILRDAIVAALFGGLALITILCLIPTGVQSPGSVEQAALSHAFWPKVLAWATLVASGLLLLEAFVPARMRSGLPLQTDEETDAQDHTLLSGLVRAVALIVLLFVYYLSLERYGIVVPSIVLLPLVMIYFGERNPLTIGILSVALPILLYLFFRYVAGIAIPLGIFG